MDITGKSGNKQEVLKNGRALVDAKSEFLQASMRGDAYGWSMETYDTDAADTIMAVRNETSNRNLHIYSVEIDQDSASVEVEFHIVTTAYTNAGTAVVGVNLNGTSKKIAEVTATTDETGNTQGDVVKRIGIQADPILVPFEGAVIIGPQQAFGVDFVTGGDRAFMCITGYFKDPDEL